MTEMGWKHPILTKHKAMKTYKTPLERKVDLCKQFCEAMANWQKLESLHDQKETEAIIKMVEMYQERIEQKGFTNN